MKVENVTIDSMHSYKSDTLGPIQFRRCLLPRCHTNSRPARIEPDHLSNGKDYSNKGCGYCHIRYLNYELAVDLLILYSPFNCVILPVRTRADIPQKRPIDSQQSQQFFLQQILIFIGDFEKVALHNRRTFEVTTSEMTESLCTLTYGSRS